MVSLAAIADAFLGRRDNWISTAKALHELGKISTEDAERVRRVATFGRLIANSDMHFGNLSFFLNFKGQFRLAPIYDMLPMLYAPVAGGVLAGQPMELPLPTADSLDIWRELTESAAAFWTTVAAHPLISREFSIQATQNLGLVQEANQLA